jgi:HSP20 family molecular chaperone IbpA
MNQQAVIDQSAETPSASEAASVQAPERPAALTFQPNVDIRDMGGEVVFTADIPGAKADGIDVTFEDGVLTMHATVPPREQAGRPIRQEYGIGNYRRSFRIGDGFDASQVTADYARGVLTVHVPRLAAVRPRKVAVRAG